MSFTRAAKDYMQAIRHLMGGQETVGLSLLALAKDPHRRNRIALGALDRQGTIAYAHAIAGLFDVPIAGYPL